MRRINNCLLIIVVGFVFWRFLVPGPKVAGDFPIVSLPSLQKQFDIPRTWHDKGAEGFGEYGLFTLWSWPMTFISGTLANFSLDFEVQERVFLLIPFILIGSFAILKVLSKLELSNSAKFVSAFFYLASTYILLLIDGGQLTIGLAYAWFPATFLVTEHSIRGGLNRKVIAGLAVSVLGFFDIRFIYVLLILLLLKFLHEIIFVRRNGIISHLILWIGSSLVIGFVYLGLNFYWILPVVLTKAPTLPATYQRVTQTSFLSFASLGHAMFLQQPHWFKNAFGKVTPLKAEFVLIPILVFLAPILVSPKESKKRTKHVGFWILVALVGIFLVKGANPPLPQVYPWLFANVPGFSLFRDPTKFFFLVALSYSVLIGISFDELARRFNWKLKIGNRKFRVFFLLFIAYLVFLARPVWLGKMTGTFSKPIYREGFFEVADILEKDNEFGRVFWIPTKAPLGYSSPTHPSVEASRLVQKRPFAIGTVGTYELFNFLREAPFMGELFDIAAIKYIAYPFPDTRREELKEANIVYYHAFSAQIENLPWVADKIYDFPVNVFKVEKSQDQFFIADNTWLVVGSDGIYSELVELANFRLSQNALIFAEEKTELGKILDLNVVNLLLYNKRLIDLSATLVERSKFIFPADNLDFDPSESSGWWKRESSDLIQWRAFLQEKYGLDNLDFDYGGGWAVSEAESSKFKIQNSKLEKGYVLLSRVMLSSRGGKVEFFQGEEKIGEIDTKIEEPEKIDVKLSGYGEIPDQIFTYDKANFSWFEIGKLPSSAPLIVETEGDINVVNAIVALPEKEWKHVNELIRGYRIYSWDELGEDEKKELFNASSEDYVVEHKRVSATHYKIKVEGVELPVTLAFSETYDSLWRLGGQGSYPLYSLINGFTLEKDGEYEIYFEPQKYVNPGLIVSGVILAASMALLMLLRKRNG